MLWFVRRGLRVLMYHKVSTQAGDWLTVTVEQLEQQVGWLKANGFQFVTNADVLATSERKSALPSRAVLLTFDDAYRDTLELALPVLQRHGARAIVFVPTAFVGQINTWDGGSTPLMSAEQLRAVVEAGWELGFHSHRHDNYAKLTTDQIAADLHRSRDTFQSLGLTPAPALAYPYGKRPQDGVSSSAVQSTLRDAGIQLAYRIGNRVNRLPLENPFDIERIGPRGDESFEAFQRRICWGRLL